MSEPLHTGDDAYWPLWVNVTVPIICVVVFFATLAILTYFKYKVPVDSATQTTEKDLSGKDNPSFIPPEDEEKTEEPTDGNANVCVLVTRESHNSKQKDCNVYVAAKCENHGNPGQKCNVSVAVTCENHENPKQECNMTTEL